MRTSLTEIAARGPMCMTMPGAVCGWAALLGALRAPRAGALPGAGDRGGRRGLRGDTVIAGAWAVLARGPSRTTRRGGSSAPRGPSGRSCGCPRTSPRPAAARRAGAGCPLRRTGSRTRSAAPAALERGGLAAHTSEWVERCACRAAERGPRAAAERTGSRGAAGARARRAARAARRRRSRAPCRRRPWSWRSPTGYGRIADAGLPAGYLDAGYLAGRRALIDLTARHARRRGAPTRRHRLPLLRRWRATCVLR